MSKFQKNDRITKGRYRWVLDMQSHGTDNWYAGFQKCNRKGDWVFVDKLRGPKYLETCNPTELLASDWLHTRPVKHEKPPMNVSQFADVCKRLGVVHIEFPGEMTLTAAYLRREGINATACGESRVKEPTLAEVLAAVQVAGRSGVVTTCGTPVGYAGRASTLDTAGCCGGMTATEAAGLCDVPSNQRRSYNDGKPTCGATRSHHCTSGVVDCPCGRPAARATERVTPQQCTNAIIDCMMGDRDGTVKTATTEAVKPPTLPDLPTPPVDEPWFDWAIWNDYLKSWYDEAREHGYGSSISTWLWSEANRLNREQKQSADDASAARQIQAARKRPNILDNRAPKPKGGGK
jgi:hypothetical protein